MAVDFELLARKALLLKNRADSLKNNIPSKAPIGVGEQIADQYNKLMEDSKSVLYEDEAFKNSIDHLPKISYNYLPSGQSTGRGISAVWPATDNTKQICSQVKIGLAEIVASLSTFVELHLSTNQGN